MQPFSDKNSFKCKLRNVKTLHAATGIADAYTKHVMGDDALLVSTRNVGCMDDLVSQSDAEQAKVIGEQLKAANAEEFEKMTGKKKENCTEMMHKIAKGNYNTTSSKGVCVATALDFASQLIGEGKDTANLKIIAERFQKGVPAKVAGYHAVYDSAIETIETDESLIDFFHLIIGNDYPNINDKEISEGICILIDTAKTILSEMQKEKIESQKEALEEQWKIASDDAVKNQISGGIQKLNNQLKNIKLPTDDPYTLLDLCLADEHNKSALLEKVPLTSRTHIINFLEKYKQLPQTERAMLKNDIACSESESMLGQMMGAPTDRKGTHKARRLLGNYTNYSNSIEHLANFDALPNGVYRPSFHPAKEMHTILYIKEGLKGYFFDPYLGLIECKGNHTNTFLKLLSMYPPPNLPPGQQLQRKDSHFPNYRILIEKIAS